MGLRVLLAEDETLVAEGLLRMLESLGHQVVARAGDGREAVRLTERFRPDAILMDIKLPRLDGIAAAREIVEVHPCPIVFLTGHAERELIAEALDSGALGYLLKPVTAVQLEAALALASRRFSEIRDFKAEQQRLRQLLEERKLVERAKGVLMEQVGLSEEAAYLRLQKRARDTNQRLGNVARALLTSQGLLTECSGRRPSRPARQSSADQKRKEKK